MRVLRLWSRASRPRCSWRRLANRRATLPKPIRIRSKVIADCGLRIADCGLRIADCGLRIADCGLRIADYEAGFPALGAATDSPESANRPWESALRGPRSEERRVGKDCRFC